MVHNDMLFPSMKVSILLALIFAAAETTVYEKVFIDKVTNKKRAKATKDLIGCDRLHESLVFFSTRIPGPRTYPA